MMLEIYERFDREAIESMLGRAARLWLRELQIHEMLDSTNSHLLRRADRGVDGVVCLAENQSAGRGRRGRTWLAIPGRGVAFSIGKQINMPIADLASVTLVAGLAVAEALDRSQIKDVSLKWPNDVLVNGVKAAGILVEVAGVATPHVVIGVGINLGDTKLIASQLGSEVGDASAGDVWVSRNALVARLIDCLVAFTQRFEAVGFEPFRATWEQLHAHQNCLADVHLGSEIVTGRILGITAIGELRLMVGNTVRVFNSGEVSLRTREDDA